MATCIRHRNSHSRHERPNPWHDPGIAAARIQHANLADIHRWLLVPRPPGQHVRRARSLIDEEDEVAAGAAPEQTTTFDANGQYGLPSERQPPRQTDTLAYDADGHLSSERLPTALRRTDRIPTIPTAVLRR